MTAMASGGPESYFMLDFRSSKGLIAATSVFMIFTDVFLYGLVVPVFPFALEERVGVPKKDLHAALSLCIGITGFGILVGSPICGHITERCATRRWPLMFGLLFLFLSTCLIRFATTLWVLVLGRLLGGLAAAQTWVVGQALLVDRIEENETGRYLGLLSVSANAALFIGPILGGMVYEKAGYAAVFDMALLLILFDVVLRFLIIEPRMLKQIMSRSNSPTRPRSPTSNGNSDLRGIDETSPLIVPSAPPLGSSGGSAKKDDENIIAGESVWLPLLTSGMLLSGIWATVLQSTLSAAIETTLPLFAKSEFGYGSQQTGWLFVNLVIPSFGAPIVGWLNDKYFSGGSLILAGFIITSPVCVALGFMSSQPLPSTLLEALTASFAEVVTDADPRRVALTCILLLAFGVASTFLTTPVSTLFASAVRDLERKGKLRKDGQGLGIAYAMSSSAYAAGAMIGPFVGGLVKGRWGWKVMTFVLAGICLVACVPLAMLLVSERQHPSSRIEETSSEDEES